jgi:hypothetical protein
VRTLLPLEAHPIGVNWIDIDDRRRARSGWDVVDGVERALDAREARQMAIGHRPPVALA